jgi:hypothetical protein
MGLNQIRRQRFQFRAALIGLFVVLVAPLVWPLVALAQEAAAATEPQQQWWQAALMPVLSAVGMAVAAIVAGAIRKLAIVFEKKFNIDIPDSIEESMTKKAHQLIASAEEKAEERLLYGDKKKTPGAEKTTAVIKELEGHAKRLGYGEEWREDRIENLIKGVLHLGRDVSIGSNGHSPDRKKKLEAAANGQ